MQLSKNITVYTPRRLRFPGHSGKIIIKVVGLTGVEPVTLRLSSACSNQLSYRPAWKGGHRARFPNLRQIGGAEESRTPDL